MTRTATPTHCHEHGQPLPAHVVAGYSPFAGIYRAVCEHCRTVFIGWECACEWAHHCRTVTP